VAAGHIGEQFVEEISGLTPDDGHETAVNEAAVCLHGGESGQLSKTIEVMVGIDDGQVWFDDGFWRARWGMTFPLLYKELNCSLLV